MCDTYVSINEDNTVIFGKNSDRMAKEAQLITFAPRKKYSSGEELRCTHISIPQVIETAAVLLSQPWWMWGAEMGVNEYGVAIGNEAIATKEPVKETGLLGMDLLRLGLERGKSAKEALKVITDLLEKYGQGGAHHQTGSNYHNSCIIADPNEVFVLETAGKYWIVEFVKEFRSISNDISIRGKGDLRHNGIIDHAIEKGYCKSENAFDFALTFSSPQHFPNHMGCSMRQLSENKGKTTPSLMMEFLRDHSGTICRHKRKDLTAGSQVSYLRKGNEKSIHWFTGSFLTCLSLFKPYVFPIGKQRVLKPGPYSELDPNWFWSRHAKFFKPFIRTPNVEIPERTIYYEKLRTMENELINKVFDVIKKENELTEEDFVKKITSINLQAWDKSLEMIK